MTGRAPSAGDGHSADASSGWTPTVAGAHLRGRAVRNTTPEVQLRRALHARGLRFRLGRKIGRFRPDIVFPGGRVVVFVDGCFWHGCPAHGPKDFRGPNAGKWRTKLAANQERDRQGVQELAELDWHVVRIWECDIKRDVNLAADQARRIIQEATAARSP